MAGEAAGGSAVAALRGPVLAVAFCAFFATVLGLVSAFQSVGNVDAAHKQQHLSEGISRAMSFTALGLGLDALVLVLLIVMTLRLRSVTPPQAIAKRMVIASATFVLRQPLEPSSPPRRTCVVSALSPCRPPFPAFSLRQGGHIVSEVIH